MLLVIATLFSWYIRDFNVKAEISKENIIGISEFITVDFKEEERHGIFRVIPSHFRGHPTGIKVHNAYNLTNGSNTYKVKYGKMTNIKIGDKNIIVKGIQKYQIDYSMQYVVFDTLNVERLVWNVTGVGWPVRIKHALFQLEIPEDIESPKNIQCYSGITGSTIKRCSCITNHNKVICETTQPLFSYQGFTVSMDFEKGTFKMPNLIIKLWWKFSIFWPILIPIFTFIFMYTKWKKHGKDPITGPVVTSYEVPQDLSPIEVGTLIDEKVNSRDLTAEILNLALNGYIKIEETPIKNEYIITKLKDCDDNLKPFQCKILQGLFEKGDTEDLLKKLMKNEEDPEYRELIVKLKNCQVDQDCQMASLSSLINKFYKVFNEVADDVYTELTTLKYFPENPKKVRDKYMLIGVLVTTSLFIFPLMRRDNSFSTWLGIISMIVSGIIIMIFANFLPRKTKKGAEVVRKIKGLLEFIARVEREKLKRFALEKPEIFKKILPYAVALGEEDKWSQVFQEVYTVLQKQTGMNNIIVSSNFNSMLTTIQKEALSSPSSSSGGSGGGFSGGGAGGGGGGAW